MVAPFDDPEPERDGQTNQSPDWFSRAFEGTECYSKLFRDEDTHRIVESGFNFIKDFTGFNQSM
jgi:hypothetical protein